MLLLTSTTDLISAVTSSTAALDVHASYVDISGTTVTPDRKNTAISTATTTNIVLAPAGSTQRNVKYVSIRNKDASASNTVTVTHTAAGGTPVELVKVLLLAGYTLTYDAGWFVTDSNGALVTGEAGGRLLRRTVLTSASANHTVGADTNKIIIRGVGGGGAGGGCTSVASAASAAGGGGAGGYAEKLFTVTPSTSYAYTCGAAGAGASGALGGAGGNSTFVVGATTVTAFGGTGGPVATAVTTLSAYKGGAGGVVSTNGDVNNGGEPGGGGFIVVVATPLGVSGAGGSSNYGAGGDSISAVGNGVAAKGFGGGGGGAMTGASTVRTGGNGTAGMWVVEEYS